MDHPESMDSLKSAVGMEQSEERTTASEVRVDEVEEESPKSFLERAASFEDVSRQRSIDTVPIPEESPDEDSTSEVADPSQDPEPILKDSASIAETSQHSVESVESVQKPRSSNEEPSEEAAGHKTDTDSPQNGKNDALPRISAIAPEARPVSGSPRPQKSASAYMKSKRRSWVSGLQSYVAPVSNAFNSRESSPERDLEVKTKRRKSFALRQKESGNSSASERSTTSKESKSESSKENARSAKAPGSVRSLKDRLASNPRMQSLPRAFSNDRIPSLADNRLPIPTMPAIPTLFNTERGSVRSELTKKRDALWSTFRSLDAEYHKFQSKSTGLKPNIVRTSLLPFLRNNCSDTSYKHLRPEDIDKRVNILNKWWVGLLEVLHGKHNQSISGSDRPILLEAVGRLMERPEWRAYPSPFCPLRERPRTPGSTEQSEQSQTSSNNEFLTESIFHNIRNLFQQNLLVQMVFVVDRMSVRNTSASVVNFAGKACAYAFLFCPGVADILVRLWELPSSTIRRVLAGNGLGKGGTVSHESRDHILSAFPMAVQHLALISLGKTVRQLRTTPPPPLGTNGVHWHGHWVTRWIGKESDLFYVFVKYFHILVCDFLPPNSTRMDRLCAPGLVLVHAQLLTNLDSTIHRQQQMQNEPIIDPANVTFDDVLGDGEAATTIPLPPSNAIRMMAENRLIMLLRDFLSQKMAHMRKACIIFAEAFSDMVKAAAKSTSLYNHSACYILCDFLEEALIILVKFETSSGLMDSLLDWPFWIDVFGQMVASQNTVTEVRVYALIYTIWPTVVKDSKRQAELCLGLLLEPAFFESRFQHWCPMVRAYFMRILCWRIARCDDNPSPTEFNILETLNARLQKVWKQFNTIQNEAQRDGKVPPSTAPSNPAPSRRLLIIRIDGALPPASNLFTFDGSVASGKKPQHERQSSTEEDQPRNRSNSALPSSPDFEENEAPRSGRLRWGMFRNFVGGSARSNSPSPRRTSNITPRDSSPSPANGHIQRPNIPTESEAGNQSGRTAEGTTRTVENPQYEAFSFKFSLERMEHKRYFNMRLRPPRVPKAAQQLLEEGGEAEEKAPSAGSSSPERVDGGNSSYIGRSLAEWTLVVSECQSFIERRKNEGVPSNNLVETPTLGVEAFKRPG